MVQISSSSEYSAADIEVLELHEAVRRRPAMYVGSLDQRGLHAMLGLAVEGLLQHYRRLNLSIRKLAIYLEQDGSATLTTERAAPSEPLWVMTPEQLWQKGLRWYFSGVISLSEHFHLTLRGPDQQWRSVFYERGVLRGDELHSCGPDASSDIWLRLWPDYSIFEPSTFSYQETLELIQPFYEEYPTTAITVSDSRSHSA